MIRKVENILRQAGQIMLQGNPGKIENKQGHANFVTQADKNTQLLLEKELISLLPGSQFYAEEKENQHLLNAPTWVVDPIDGTLNFIHQLRHSAISVALVENEKVLLGFVYNPYHQEMFTAQAEKGARLNDKPIFCSDTPLPKALTLFGTSPYEEDKLHATLKAVKVVMKKTADVRRFGSAALDLAYVACGRADVFFEFALSSWDYAAGLLLVQEAGGRVELINIQENHLDLSATAALIAANSVCFEEAAKLIRPFYHSIQK